MTLRFLVYLILLFIVIVLNTSKYKQLTNSFKVVLAFIIFIFTTELTTRYFAFEYRNTNPVYHLYIPIQFFFITLFYSAHLKKMNTFFSWAILGFLVLSIFNTIFLQDVFTTPSNIMLVSSVFYIVYSVLVFKKMLTQTTNQSLMKQELFWFNIATLIFYSFTFLCWSFYNYLIKANPNTKLITDMIYTLNLLYYSILGLSLYLNASKSK